MKHMLLSLIPLCLSASGLLANPNISGPDYAPPFEVKQTQRQAPELAVKTFIDHKSGKSMESPSLSVGNKRVAVREFGANRMNADQDYSISILLNNKQVFSFLFAGSYRNAEQKWIGFTQNNKRENTKLSIGRTTGVIKWSSRYPLPDGQTTEFSYQLKSLGDSKIELSWDIGCTEQQCGEFNRKGCNIRSALLYFEIPDYHKNTLEINGKN